MGEKEQLMSAAEAFVENDEFNEAILSYESAVELDPGDPDVQMKLASVLINVERIEDAASAWATAAEIYQGQGLLSEALDTQKKVVDALPASTSAVERLAELHIQLDQSPNAVKALRNAAAMHRTNQDHPKRLAAISRVLDLDDENLRGRVRYAETLAESGAPQQAAAELKKALGTLEKAQNWPAFEAIAKRCLNLDTSNADVSCRLARYLLDNNRSAEAIFALHKAYGSNPENIELLGYIAEACNDAGQPQKAVVVLNKKAQICEQQGLDRQAKEVRNQIRIIDPTTSATGLDPDEDQGFNEFEAGELKIADISDEEIDALLQEIERAETEDEFSVGAFLDELHGEPEAPLLPPPDHGPSKTMTQRGLDVPFAANEDIKANFSEDDKARAVATTELALPIPDFSSAGLQQSPPPAPHDNPPPPPPPPMNHRARGGAAYADTLQVDFVEGLPPDPSPGTIARQDTVPHRPLGNTQDWGAPHFIEPIEDEAPQLPTELLQDDSPQHTESFGSTTAIGTSKEVIGASLEDTTEKPPPPPFQSPRSAPKPIVVEAEGAEPSFTETTPFTPPDPGAVADVQEDGDDDDFTETMPVRPPGNMKATMPTPPPFGYSESQSTPPPIPHEAPTAAPAATDELSAELEELDFYLESGLADEARELLEEIQSRFGDSPAIEQRKAQLDA